MPMGSGLTPKPSSSLENKPRNEYEHPTIQIHPMFWAVIFVATMVGEIYTLAFLFTIVCLHECGHWLAAHCLGWRVYKVELLPFGGVIETESTGTRPYWQEWIVVSAGPAVHLLVFGALIILQFYGIGNEKDIALLQQLNWTVLFFNLLPIWPLDGGRMVALFLMLFVPFYAALWRTWILTIVVIASGIYLILRHMPLHLTAWVVILFLLISLWRDIRYRTFTFMRFLYARYQRSLPLREVSVNVVETLSLFEVLRKIYRQTYTL
ncbi:MAG: site-2 protease family protein, partial [Bacilli bacterium]